MACFAIFENDKQLKVYHYSGTEKADRIRAYNLAKLNCREYPDQTCEEFTDHCPNVGVLIKFESKQ